MAWYAVQVHQTKYLMEIGFTPAVAATALGLVSFMGIGGQIRLGHLSDCIGREWAWTLACLPSGWRPAHGAGGGRAPRSRAGGGALRSGPRLVALRRRGARAERLYSRRAVWT
jgi:hypothetical protein